MPNIKPISDLRNYTAVMNEVTYGNRVYLTRNGHGSCAIIDIEELDELDKMKALNKLLLKLQTAEKSVLEEGTVSADELEKELGGIMSSQYTRIIARSHCPAAGKTGAAAPFFMSTEPESKI